jgi:hypothetical protein
MAYELLNPLPMWSRNGLSIVLFTLFLASLAGHSVSGWKEYNDEQQEHGQEQVTYVEYLGTSEFGETIFENWESEFLQMAMYVFLTVFLQQKGSSESKDMDEPSEIDEDPLDHRHDPGAPWPVRKGGWILSLYKNSLGLAFALLFLISFVGHAATGAAKHNAEAAEHGKTEHLTAIGYMGEPSFWYESFQNWQSEFLAVFSIVVLSIWLRQWGSPESKPVHAAHSDTGSS